jgi:hypothetical protein
VVSRLPRWPAPCEGLPCRPRRPRRGFFFLGGTPCHRLARAGGGQPSEESVPAAATHPPEGTAGGHSVGIASADAGPPVVSYSGLNYRRGPVSGSVKCPESRFSGLNSDFGTILAFWAEQFDRNAPRSSSSWCCSRLECIQHRLCLLCLQRSRPSIYV